MTRTVVPLVGPDPRQFSLSALTTPALVVDVAALERNIAVMAHQARTVGMPLRPHIKTHKCAEIAQRQVDAGAVGIACATVAELAYFVKSGFRDVLLTSAIVDRHKAAVVADLSRCADITVVVDHLGQVQILNDVIRTVGGSLRVLIDIDVGQQRCGVVDITACLDLASAIEEASQLHFGGIQGFAGQAQHIVNESARRKAAAEVADHLRACIARLRTIGLAVEQVTGSGTGTCAYDVAGPYTELQVGSYVFMDADYARIEGSAARGLGFERSLFVLTSVVSTNRAGQVSVDAGIKAFAQNGPMPKLIYGMPSGTEYRFAGDEHGVLILPPGFAAPTLGSRLLIEATHCDPTVNLYAGYAALQPDGNVERWEIGGRYA